MTESQEPTLAELLAFMREQAAALQALTEMTQAGFAHVMADVSGVRDEVQRSEASVTARIADVQNVVRTLSLSQPRFRW